MIPKKINYIWLGGKELPVHALMCINSWRRIMPNYEIVQWNEYNLPLAKIAEKNKFFAKCRKLKLWGFMSDYLRLRILYEYGGIYLDTDIETLKPFDDLLQNGYFMGYEVGDTTFGLGDYIGSGIIGAESHNNLIKRLLDFYEDEIWNSPFYVNTMIYKSVYLKDPDAFSHGSIYPIDYFSPFQWNEQPKDLVETDNTYSIHWYSKNWNMTRQGYVFLNTKHYMSRVEKVYQIIRKNLGYCKRKNSKS